MNEFSPIPTPESAPYSVNRLYIDRSLVRSFEGRDSRCPIKWEPIVLKDGATIAWDSDKRIYGRPLYQEPQKIEFNEQPKIRKEYRTEKTIQDTSDIPTDLFGKVALHIEELVIERAQIYPSARIVRKGGELVTSEFQGGCPTVQEYPFLIEQFSVGKATDLVQGVAVIQTDTSFVLLGHYLVDREPFGNARGEMDTRKHANQIFLKMDKNKVTIEFIKRMFESQDPDVVLKSLFGVLGEINPKLDLSGAYRFQGGEVGYMWQYTNGYPVPLVNMTDLPILQFPEDSIVYDVYKDELYKGLRRLHVRSGTTKESLEAYFSEENYYRNPNVSLILSAEQSRIIYESLLADETLFVFKNPTDVKRLVFTAADIGRDRYSMDKQRTKELNRESKKMAQQFLSCNPGIPQVEYVEFTKNGTSITELKQERSGIMARIRKNFAKR